MADCRLTAAGGERVGAPKSAIGNLQSGAMALRLDSPVQYVKGVGPRLAERLATLNIGTVGDLLAYYPFRYEVEHGELEIAALRAGITATVRGEVLRVGGRWPGLTAQICDGTECCTLRWFNRQHAGRGLTVGAAVIATGKVQEYNGRLELIQPRIQVFPPGAVLMSPTQGRRCVGVYRSNARISSATIARIVRNVLEQTPLPVEEILPPALLRKRQWPDRAAAVRQMHSPSGGRELEQARRRLAYEEFLLLELAMALRRRRLVTLQTGRRLHVTPEIDRRIRARFPFPLTPAQDKVVGEIARDLASGRPMTRLLQGDVGSGKTVVALYACLVAVANRRQSAIMAPTEILAQQHFHNIEKYLAGSRVRRTLLRGGLGRTERLETLAAIERGQIDLVVGTQALLEQDVAFRDLALVVVDEQHKFGVLQRADIRTKGPLPHYLVMTATPIPRTLAMTVFGDLDLSIIDAMPPGRGKIITRVVARAQWETVMSYVRRRLEAGEQAYVVCPSIGEQEAPQGRSAAETGRRGEAASAVRAARLVSATRAFDRLTQGPWRGLNVGLLHGALPAPEKRRIVEDFVAGRLHAVVATTVVEVGVDVPNATIMVVENAERFGLSQLHQLRGRVGRGTRDSLCVLIAHGRSGKAAQRLAVMAETTDGFRIAEADLRQRGPGELFGTRQHGLPELRVGDMLNDLALLEQARQDAFELVARDPQLEQPEHAALLPALRRMFADRLALIDAG